jgi:copper chaperone
MLRSITFEVVGEQKLHCEGCEQRVEKMLKTMSGVDTVRANARHQRVEVLFDASALEPSAISARLHEAGYKRWSLNETEAMACRWRSLVSAREGGRPTSLCA